MTKGAVNEPEKESYLGEQESKESVDTGAKKGTVPRKRSGPLCC